MDVIVERCAGLDVGKEEVVAAVRTPGDAGRRRQDIRTFPTFTASLEEMAGWLEAEGVTQVVMEATGQYWKPVWYVLEARGGFELLLVNARHVKILPGRKTDVADAAWLAELLEHGLLRSSFVPPAAIRELRDLTRYRKRLVQNHASECQRIQKTLEDAGIKLDSVASDVLGASGRAMLKALVAGERDPEVLAEMAKGTLRKKIPLLRQALYGRFSGHHGLIVGLALNHVEHMEAAIASLDVEVDRVMAPFAEARDHLDTITGVGKRAAECIIAEIGTDMSRFPTAGHLASWAGMCPGNNITGGKRRSGKTNKGDRWLAEILNECAWAAARSRNTYLSAQFWRLTHRMGKKKAAVAVGHSILVIAWHLLAESCDYADLGGDWFTRGPDPDRRETNLVRQLQALGYAVTLRPAA
ncbi:MAG: IS110 family transposase [Actinomycetota bacterium]|jgi:transposase|nr:IS110 family transposase [Actinomycetota bacterium]